jgi:endonuclease YncB( thermonuclease family)
VVGAHDGDTISVVIMQESKAARFNVRLDGIDTPEMTSADSNVKDLAIAARNRLISLLTRGHVTLPVHAPEGKKLTRTDINTKLCERVHIVFLECRGMDKYGRVLGVIYLDESPSSKSANQIMLDEGLAKPYSGGTKDMW